MAQKKATLVLEMKDLASKGVNKFGAALKTLRQHWLGITAAVGGSLIVIKKALDAWGVQEKAIMKLETSLKNAGQEVENSSRRLQKLASDLQDLTGYGDEAIIGIQSLQASFGFTTKEIEQLTPRILDLSAAMGVDMRTATLALGKAISTGTVGELKRYGVMLDDSIIKSGDMTRIVEGLDKQFGGIAETVGRSTSGQMMKLSAAMGDLMEEIGKLVSGPSVKFIRFLTDATKKTIILIDVIGKSTDKIKAFASAMYRLTRAISTLGLSEVNRKVREWTRGEEEVTEAVEETTKEVKKQSQEVQKLGVNWERVLNNARNMEVNFTGDYRSEYIKRMDAAQLSFERTASFHQQLMLQMEQQNRSMANIFAGTVGSMVNRFGDGMAEMIVHGGSFKDQMNNMGKALVQEFIASVIKKMIAEWAAMLATKVALNRAANTQIMASNMTTAGVPVGAGGGVGAGGFLGGVIGVGGGMMLGSALGSNIGGKDTNKGGAMVGSGVGALIGMGLGGPVGGLVGGAVGGVVGGGVQRLGKSVKKKFKKAFSGGVINEPTAMLGLKTGQVGIAGEAGVPEALISFPEMGLSPQQGRERLLGRGGGGGGGSTTVVNVYAGTIVADDNGITKLTEAIDRKLYQLKLSRQTVSI